MNSFTLNDDVFPFIEHLDDILPKVSHVPEIRLIEQDNGYKTLCYMFSGGQTFKGENVKWLRECRGITFYPNGDIASRPFHKFFNVNECEQTLEHNLDFSSVHRISDKRDGSMLHPVLINGEPTLKSKKSFNSDVAILANLLMDKTPRISKLSKDLLIEGFTPIFEFTSPEARIVLRYPEQQLTLLHVRNTKTGAYLPLETVRYISGQYRVIMVEELEPIFSKNCFASYKQELMSSTGVEGYVIQFQSGDMVKLKSPWYLARHHIAELTEFQAAEMVMEETIDDIKSLLNEDQNVIVLSKVEQIELQVRDLMIQFQNDISTILEENKDLSFKDLSLKFQEHEYHHVIMKTARGNSDVIKKHFMSKILPSTFRKIKL